MAEIASTVAEIASASDWDSRVALIRKVPANFGTDLHREIYSQIAERIYVPHLAPDFGYVHWRDEYEIAAVEEAYASAYEQTDGFSVADTATITQAIVANPKTLLVFRLLLGLTPQEFATSTQIIAEGHGLSPVGSGRIKSLESGSACPASIARCCALVVQEMMQGELFGMPPSSAVRPKISKPDTLEGWATVRRFAREGVPLAVFLHQRHYGGAFRQILDATSARRGDLLEDAVAALFDENGIEHIRTGSHNQEEIGRRFGLTVRPAPDFVVSDAAGTLRALLECKVVNDGGTARDKAARYATLRAECLRLGGVPLFAVLSGLGWKRTSDALGPVVRDTDGRVFTLPTLRDLLTVQPFADLIAQTATKSSPPAPSV